MKIWTWTQATPTNPYWMSGSDQIVLIEEDNGHLHWNNVSDGIPHALSTIHRDYHCGKLLDPVYWPEWYRSMDEHYVDVGI